MATRQELEAREDVQERLAVLKADPRYTGKRFRPIDTTIGVVIVINPSRGQYNVTGAQLLDDDKGASFKAFSGLFRMCVVDPAPAVLTPLLEDMSGALDEPEAMKEFRRHIGHCREVDQK